MPALESYDKSLDYSYAPGLFPSMECILKRPESARRLLVSSKAEDSEGLRKLIQKCEEKHVRVETADKALSRISGKENCFAAMVFDKFVGQLQESDAHIVLHHPGDKGNLGTILRTALGFQYKSIALIRPAADAFDPHVIRASMGAVFSLQLKYYNTFEEYRAEFPGRALFPFMLDGAVSPEEAAAKVTGPFSLVMGNEGSGLPPEFAQMGQAVRIPHSNEIDSLNLSIATAIGMYLFQKS